MFLSVCFRLISFFFRLKHKKTFENENNFENKKKTLRRTKIKKTKNILNEKKHKLTYENEKNA
jgi:hypothetical protein